MKKAKTAAKAITQAYARICPVCGQCAMEIVRVAGKNPRMWWKCPDPDCDYRVTVTQAKLDREAHSYV